MNRRTFDPSRHERRALTLLETLAAAALLSLILGAAIPLVCEFAATGHAVRLQHKDDRTAIALRLIADELARHPRIFELDPEELVTSNEARTLSIPASLDGPLFHNVQKVEVRCVHTCRTDDCHYALVELKSASNCVFQVLRIGKVERDESGKEPGS